MKIVNIHEAKTTLSALLGEVERGEEVVIARNGEPIAKLSRLAPVAPREPGAWRDLPGWRGYTYDKAAFAPLDGADMEAEGWP